MKIVTNISLLVIATALCVIATLLIFKPMYQAYGEAFTGTATNPKLATTTSVGPSTTRMFAANTACKARVVTTLGTNPVYIIFADQPGAIGNLSSSTISATAGHLQAPSTTQEYDSGIYGCGTWYVKSPTASTTVTITEFQ